MLLLAISAIYSEIMMQTPGLENLTIIVAGDYKRFCIGRRCYAFRNNAFHQLGTAVTIMGVEEFIKGRDVELLC